MSLLVLAYPAISQTPTQIPQENTAPTVITTQPPEPKSLELGEYYISALHQRPENSGSRIHAEGAAQIESTSLLVRADTIDYDDETHIVVAQGHVYFHQFAKNEQIWCDHLRYNTFSELGEFWDVRGELTPKVVNRRGVLSGNSPFYFQGQFAERVGAKYILYKGWMTNCKLPNPWWRLKGPKFDITPGDNAVAHDATFVLKTFPIFFTPFFYHSLKKEPRHSGILVPNIVPHSQRGFMVGLGYYWAPSRSYDVTYHLYDYNSSALSHHVEFRGKPSNRSDFDLIVSGVQDLSGDPKSGTPPQKYSGVEIYGTGKVDLGAGWTGMGIVNYVTSFRFRQEWTQSFTEGIGSEFHTLGFVNKDFDAYTFDISASRTENFQPEIATPGPNGSTNYLTNAAIIRKLPEFDFSGRDQQPIKQIPLYFSFDSSAGLMYRSQPDFNGNTLIYNYQTGQLTSRLRFAPKISSAFHLWGINFTPSVGLDEAYYGESQTVQNGINHIDNGDISRTARNFTLDIALPMIERVYNKKTIFGDKLKHVIESRATYKYQTGIGTDFDRIIRFDENDLLANTNELALSIINRVYAKRGDSVQEIFTWELTQKRYFDPTFGGALVSGQRNVFDATADVTAFAFLTGPRSTSPVASVLRASPIAGLGIQWMADYDPRVHRIVDSSFSVDYRWKRYYFVNVGNDEVHSDPILSGLANQYRFGGGFGDPQHRGFNAASNSVFDARQGTLLYWNTQVTYNTNCCGLSVEYRRINFGIRDESYYAFSFAIANVGTFGTLKKQDRLF